jgi:hypothetical protein
MNLYTKKKKMKYKDAPIICTVALLKKFSSQAGKRSAIALFRIEINGKA